jgi:hypothetical protein
MLGPVSQGALIERQQIVVPNAISIRTQVRRMPCGAHDADIGPRSGPWINNKESIALRVDALDHLFARPRPTRFRIAEVGYVFVGALGVRFSDTSNLDFGHNGSF